MPIVGGLDIHRKQITFDYLDTETGEVQRGQISPADRLHLRAWLARFGGRDDVAFAVEGCAGWRYVAEELAAAGITAHLAEPADTAARRGRKRHAKTDKTDDRFAGLRAADIEETEIGRQPGDAVDAQKVGQRLDAGKLGKKLARRRRIVLPAGVAEHEIAHGETGRLRTRQPRQCRPRP